MRLTAAQALDACLGALDLSCRELDVCLRSLGGCVRPFHLGSEPVGDALGVA
jgi:hypothetical protein